MLRIGLWELWISQGEALDSLDTYHIDEGQILTTTDALAFPLVGVCEREVEKVKILEL